MKKNYFILFCFLAILCHYNNPVKSQTISFLSFKFLKTNNPSLKRDLNMTISGNQISGQVNYLTKIDSLVASFEIVGKKVVINGVIQTSDTNPNDFSNEVSYTIIGENGTRVNYTVNLILFTGLPVLFIETENKQRILSKDRYLNGSLKFIGNRHFDNDTTSIRIKGRGNTSWIMPKKSYQISFKEKTSLTKTTPSKKWVLLANYSDKTMLRNKTAFEMGQLSSLNWTPKSNFVELFINKQYKGTYQLTEKIEISKGKIDIGKNGFLLEIDTISKTKKGDTYFTTPKELLVVIKEPELDNKKYNYIKDRICNIESILYGNNFLNIDSGYAKHIDIKSFIDWYLINEIAKNNDAKFHSSVYMHIKPDGKLKMGPIWDFDIGFGNINYNGNDKPEGFWIKDSKWISRLFEDPKFVHQVKLRFQYFYSLKSNIVSNVKQNSIKLTWAQKKNNRTWNTINKHVWPNAVVLGSYEKEVDYLINWIETRMDWLNEAFKKL